MDQHERVRPHRRALIAGCGALAVAASGLAAAQAQAATTPEAFTLTVGQPSVSTVDLGQPGKSPGDLYAIIAPAFDGSGAEVGRLVATQTSIRLERRAETVQAIGTFELRDGTIVIGGLSQYPRSGVGNVAGEPFVRPVIGGTGRYAGVGGTVTTTRGPDGRYQQRFALTGVPAPTERFRARSNGVPMQRIDLGTSGPTNGDLHVFATPMVNEQNRIIGRLLGVFTTVDTSTSTETVDGAMTFELPGGQIAVSGTSELPLGDSGLVRDMPFARAVVGGTGRFAGRAGTVTTTRTPSGRYEQTFDLQPRPQLTGTLRVEAGRGRFSTVDLAPAGQSPADMTVFGSVVRDRRGHRIGRARGVQTTISRDGRVLTVQAGITYDLRGGSLVVGGLSLYPSAGRPAPIAGRRFVRPVLGGTGRYAGTRGTLTTVQRRDGGFGQTFRLTE